MKIIQMLQDYKVVGKMSNVERIVIHHTAGNKNNRIPSMSSPDYGYHYAICWNGDIIQLQSYTNVVQHIGGLNSGSIGIALHGNFEEYEPSNEQIKSLDELVNNLLTTFPDANIIGHNEGKGQHTLCPGKYLLPYIKEIRNKINNNIPNNIQTFKCDCGVIWKLTK